MTDKVGPPRVDGKAAGRHAAAGRGDPACQGVHATIGCNIRMTLDDFGRALSRADGPAGSIRVVWVTSGLFWVTL